MIVVLDFIIFSITLANDIRVLTVSVQITYHLILLFYFLLSDFYLSTKAVRYNLSTVDCSCFQHRVQ